MPAPAQLFVDPRRSLGLSPETFQPLRQRLAQHVESSVLDLLDPDRLLALAEDLRAVEKARVHHPGLVIGSLVLSAFQQPSDTGGRWLDAQTIYEQLGGLPSADTGFRRYCHKMLPVMQCLLNRRLAALQKQTQDEALRGRLSAFADVLVPDGCAFKLASVLAGFFPGTGTPAELKLHAVYSFKTDVATVEMSPGRVHDTKGFVPTTWQKGALYIWDLGFNDEARFVDAALAGAVVLQRLKSTANPVVLAIYDALGAKRVPSRRMRLDEASQALAPAEGVFDADVRLRDDDGREVVARVVCVPHGGEDRYYLTTLPRSIFTPHDVAELYRLRWEVELFFRAWHGTTRMDAVRRLSNAKSVEVHVVASLLAMTLVRDIHQGLQRLQRIEEEETMGPGGRRQAQASKPAEQAFPPCAEPMRARAAGPVRGAKADAAEQRAVRAHGGARGVRVGWCARASAANAAWGGVADVEVGGCAGGVAGSAKGEG
jgi:Transposase DDE domain